MYIENATSGECYIMLYIPVFLRDLRDFGHLVINNFPCLNYLMLITAHKISNDLYKIGHCFFDNSERYQDTLHHTTLKQHYAYPFVFFSLHNIKISYKYRHLS